MGIMACSMRSLRGVEQLGSLLPFVWLIAGASAAISIPLQQVSMMTGLSIDGSRWNDVYGVAPVMAWIIGICFVVAVALHVAAVAMIGCTTSPSSVVRQAFKRAFCFPIIFLITVLPVWLTYASFVTSPLFVEWSAVCIYSNGWVNALVYGCQRARNLRSSAVHERTISADALQGSGAAGTPVQANAPTRPGGECPPFRRQMSPGSFHVGFGRVSCVSPTSGRSRATTLQASTILQPSLQASADPLQASLHASAVVPSSDNLPQVDCVLWGAFISTTERLSIDPMFASSTAGGGDTGTTDVHFASSGTSPDMYMMQAGAGSLSLPFVPIASRPLPAVPSLPELKGGVATSCGATMNSSCGTPTSAPACSGECFGCSFCTSRLTASLPPQN